VQWTVWFVCVCVCVCGVREKSEQREEGKRALRSTMGQGVLKNKKQFREPTKKKFQKNPLKADWCIIGVRFLTAKPVLGLVSERAENTETGLLTPLLHYAHRREKREREREREREKRKRRERDREKEREREEEREREREREREKYLEPIINLHSPNFMRPSWQQRS